MGKLKTKKKVEQPVVKKPAPVKKPISIKEKLEQKRLDKLSRARAQAGWHEDWLLYNDRADKAAGRARERHPVPAAVQARVRQVDDVARRALRAAVCAVEASAAARPARQRGDRHGRLQR